MGRAALLIDQSKMESVIAELESSNTYATVSELCEAVANSDFGKSIKNTKFRVKGISPQKVYQFIRESGIIPKTKPGRRGPQTGTRVTRRSKADRIKNNPTLVAWVAGMMRQVKLPEVPERFQRVVEKAAEGNVRACVTLTCAQCVGYESQAWKTCRSTTCGTLPLNLLMWPSRKVAAEDKDDWKLYDEGQEPAGSLLVQLTSGKGFTDVETE